MGLGLTGDVQHNIREGRTRCAGPALHPEGCVAPIPPQHCHCRQERRHLRDRRLSFPPPKPPPVTIAIFATNICVHQDIRQKTSWCYPARDTYSGRRALQPAWVTDVAFCPIATQPPPQAQTQAVQHQQELYGTDESGALGVSSGVTSLSGGSTVAEPLRYDSNVFMSAHVNGSLSLWDLRKAQFPLMTVSGHQSNQNVKVRMEWHPLGLYLATCGAGGVKLWTVRPQAGPAGMPHRGGTSCCINLVQWIKSKNSVSTVHWRPLPGELTTEQSSWPCTAAAAVAAHTAAEMAPGTPRMYNYQLGSCPQSLETFVSLWDCHNTNIPRALIGDFVPESPTASLYTTTTISNFVWLDSDSIIAIHNDGKLHVSTLAKNTRVPFKTLRPVSFAMDPKGVITAATTQWNISNPVQDRILTCAPEPTFTPLNPTASSHETSEPSLPTESQQQTTQSKSTTVKPQGRHIPTDSRMMGQDLQTNQLPWLTRTSSCSQYMMDLYRSSSSIMTKASEDYVFREMARRCLLAPFGDIKDKWMVCRYNARVSEELRCPHYAQLWTLAQHAFQKRDVAQGHKTDEHTRTSHHVSDIASIFTSPADSSTHIQGSRSAVARNALFQPEHQEEAEDDVKAFTLLFNSHQDEFVHMGDETVHPVGQIPTFTMDSLCRNCKTEDTGEVSTTNQSQQAQQDYEQQCAIFQKTVCEIIQMYSEIGFFQICALVFLVLGDTLSTQESLAEIRSRSILFYIRALQHMKLYLEASAVIRLCPPSCIAKGINLDKPFRELNHVNTSFEFTSIPSQQTPHCCVCGLKVTGLSVWCPGCGHGGHIEHIRAWLERSSQCPSGCSHICKFTPSVK